MSAAHVPALRGQKGGLLWGSELPAEGRQPTCSFSTLLLTPGGLRGILHNRCNEGRFLP